MNFTVYRSSAGSGKTFTLVKEYLRLVLKEPQHYRNILAITFTNKAAAEMKERILGALRDLSEIKPAKPSSVHKVMLPMLMKETKLSADVIALRAAETLKLILHNYSDFAITTIDSFIHRIIRTFSFDLRLPANFDVELDEELLVAQAVDLLVSKAGSDDDLTRVLVEFSQSKADDEKSFHIEKDMLKMAMSITREDAQMHLKRLSKLSLSELLEIRKKLVNECRQFEEDVIRTAAPAAKLILDSHIEPSSFFQGTRGIGAYFNNLAKGYIEKIIPNSYVRDTIDNNKWTGGKCPANEAEKINAISGELAGIYRNIQSLAERGYSRYIIFCLVRDNFYPLALLNEVNKVVDELKAEENLVMISEFNKLIANIVMQEPVPFIYERLGVRFKHFLIDEFQDTSIMQWQNLLPLLENGLAEDKFSMVVGDGKQAIYRWRNGEVEQFDKLPEIYHKPALSYFDEREATLIRNYQCEPLDSNYRSGDEIVRFNNSFFSFLAQSLDPDYQRIYAGLEQKPGKALKGGYVHIEFLTEEDEENEPIKIRTLLEDLIREDFRLSDIAILCRSNITASLIARDLLLAGIPVLSAESLLLSGAPVVNFMIALLRNIREPFDDISRTEIVRFLHYRGMLGDDDLHTCMRSILKRNHPKDLFDKSTVPAEDFNTLLKRNGYELPVSRLTKMPLYDLCEELVRIFKLQSPADPYLLFWLDAVQEYASGKGSDISGFLTWWEEEKTRRSIIIPEGIDAVRIMTIHKSKGLEFPVVIYPYADQGLRSTIDKAWVEFDDEALPGLDSVLLTTGKALNGTKYEHIHLQETAKSRLDFINILYVVMTRPVERLYVIAGKPSKDPSNMKSVPDCFIQYLNSLGMIEEGKKVFTFGTTKRMAIAKHGRKDISITTNKLISEPWQNRVMLSLQSPKAWDTEDPDRKRKWGNLLHTALSKVMKPEDVKTVIDQFLIEGKISKDQQQDLDEIMNKVINQPELKILFDTTAQIFTEAEILTAEGKTYRPDRVVIKGNTVSIVDYKSGIPSQKDHEQLDLYSRLLIDMGFTSVKKHLVYLGENVNVQIS